MANCDMCGKENRLVIAEIEGTKMNVCSICGRFGKIIREPGPVQNIEKHMPKKRMQDKQGPKIIEMIVPDYPQIIRKKREKMGMKQKEFAGFIAEKESLLHSIETGKFEPSLALGKKLEKLLNVNLIEEVEDIKTSLPVNKSENSSAFTLGDFIKKKNNK